MTALNTYRRWLARVEDDALRAELSALDEVRERYGFPTASIVDMGEVTEHLLNRECQGRVVIDDKVKAALDAYYEQYGAKR